MFSTGHFIWLGAFAVAIAVTLFVIKRLNISQYVIQKTVFVLLLVLKIFHLSLSLKETSDGGIVINQTQLSFHLCSIVIYMVFIINIIKNEKIIATLKSFMVPCMLLGAAMALLIPTEGVDPSVPRVWQYMLIHATLVFYGLYLMIVEKVDLSFKAYLTNLKILLGIMLMAFLMNSVLEQYNTNFLFLRKPPMDNLPILNLNNGWYVYFLTLVAVACVLIFTVHIPYLISRSRAKK